MDLTIKQYQETIEKNEKCYNKKIESIKQRAETILKKNIKEKEKKQTQQARINETIQRAKKIKNQHLQEIVLTELIKKAKEHETHIQEIQKEIDSKNNKIIVLKNISEQRKNEITRSIETLKEIRNTTQKWLLTPVKNEYLEQVKTIQQKNKNLPDVLNLSKLIEINTELGKEEQQQASNESLDEEIQKFIVDIQNIPLLNPNKEIHEIAIPEPISEQDSQKIIQNKEKKNNIHCSNKTLEEEILEELKQLNYDNQSGNIEMQQYPQKIIQVETEAIFFDFIPTLYNFLLLKLSIYSKKNEQSEKEIVKNNQEKMKGSNELFFNPHLTHLIDILKRSIIYQGKNIQEYIQEDFKNTYLYIKDNYIIHDEENNKIYGNRETSFLAWIIVIRGLYYTRYDISFMNPSDKGINSKTLFEECKVNHEQRENYQCVFNEKRIEPYSFENILLNEDESLDTLLYEQDIFNERELFMSFYIKQLKLLITNYKKKKGITQ